MGPNSDRQIMLDNKRYDLHGLQLKYRKALDGGTSQEDIEQLHRRIITLKEEINSLIVVIDFPGLNRTGFSDN
ncbi:hypothetical protein [Telluribacter sp. SYSU D00476]|uniref:hypothetical protein n=1 Tax=Telluribacter sp. SYSU D00476 TaxID=2811430 RepID=UPI001FF50B9F|nr:hypothetical protein [Telluribacter sp. SYSU D00476]